MSAVPQPSVPRRVFVVHGYQAAPDRHWFPWLVERLAADGFTVTVVALPESNNPEVQAWSAALTAAVSEVDAQTWFVGHSLGCITVLRHLSALVGPWAAAGVVLVAGFEGPLESVPELRHFLGERIDPAARRRIIDRVPQRLMVRSDHDIFVPAAASDTLAAAIEAPVVVITGAGHFMGSDGVVELPVVLSAITGRG